jgi:hypothetical protein
MGTLGSTLGRSRERGECFGVPGALVQLMHERADLEKLRYRAALRLTERIERRLESDDFRLGEDLRRLRFGPVAPG